MSAEETARLGARFAKLWAASTVSALGSGLAIVAAPLFVVNATPRPPRRPRLVPAPRRVTAGLSITRRPVRRRCERTMRSRRRRTAAAR